MLLGKWTYFSLFFFRDRHRNTRYHRFYAVNGILRVYTFRYSRSCVVSYNDFNYFWKFFKILFRLYNVFNIISNAKIRQIFRVISHQANNIRKYIKYLLIQIHLQIYTGLQDFHWPIPANPSLKIIKNSNKQSN